MWRKREEGTKLLKEISLLFMQKDKKTKQRKREKKREKEEM